MRLLPAKREQIIHCRVVEEEKEEGREEDEDKEEEAFWVITNRLNQQLVSWLHFSAQPLAPVPGEARPLPPARKKHIQPLSHSLSLWFSCLMIRHSKE